MAKYSSADNIYPEQAPYQPSRSALRRRFGNRAIVSHGPEHGKDLPGSDAARALGRKGLTEDATWNDFFHSKDAKLAGKSGAPVNYAGAPITGTNYMGADVAIGGAPAPAAAAAAPAPTPSSAATYYPPALISPSFGESLPDVVRSGTNFVTKFGWGGVRSTADMKAGRNAPQDLSAWDAFLKSPAPAAPPPTSMSLLPSPRQGTPTVPQRNSDFSPTPTADDYYGAILSKPSKLSITTGVLDRLAGPSPWEEPI